MTSMNSKKCLFLASNLPKRSCDIIKQKTFLFVIKDENISIDNDELLEDEDQQLYEHFRIVADEGQKPLRVDKFMFEKLQHSSRNRIQKAAEAGFVHVNDQPVKSNYKIRPKRRGYFDARSPPTR